MSDTASIRDNDLVAFAMAVAHWSEVGELTAGSLPTNATKSFKKV